MKEKLGQNIDREGCRRKECVECLKKDAEGKEDEDNGAFYCFECWKAFEEPDFEEMMKAKQEKEKTTQCQECGSKEKGKIDATDGSFYCNACWAAMDQAFENLVIKE